MKNNPHPSLKKDEYIRFPQQFTVNEHTDIPLSAINHEIETLNKRRNTLALSVALNSRYTISSESSILATPTTPSEVNLSLPVKAEKVEDELNRSLNKINPSFSKESASGYVSIQQQDAAPKKDIIRGRRMFDRSLSSPLPMNMDAIDISKKWRMEQGGPCLITVDDNLRRPAIPSRQKKTLHRGQDERTKEIKNFQLFKRPLNKKGANSNGVNTNIRTDKNKVRRASGSQLEKNKPPKPSFRRSKRL